MVQWQLANKHPEAGGPAGCPAPGHLTDLAAREQSWATANRSSPRSLATCHALKVSPASSRVTTPLPRASRSASAAPAQRENRWGEERAAWRRDWKWPGHGDSGGGRGDGCPGSRAWLSTAMPCFTDAGGILHLLPGPALAGVHREVSGTISHCPTPSCTTQHGWGCISSEGGRNQQGSWLPGRAVRAWSAGWQELPAASLGSAALCRVPGVGSAGQPCACSAGGSMVLPCCGVPALRRAGQIPAPS